MRENLTAESFARALIPKELKIICKVLRGKENIQGGVGGECLFGNQVWRRSVGV
jgi:hypothetical protein